MSKPFDDVDPACAKCGQRRFSDCCCVEPRYRAHHPEVERQLRAAARPTLLDDLREAGRIARERAR